MSQGKAKYGYGYISDISRDSIEITEMDKKHRPRNTTWWVDWPEPAKTMPVGTRVSFIEVKPEKYKTFIRNIEKRYA